ncbi:MAG TPA: GNAT family N-acetyltransferase [Clostridiaceae bacterium]|nr:GNAT family N-acetyltransferase [Clostridiaceae bacterium]
MSEYIIVKITQKPAIKEEAANWFHEKWGVPREAYLKSMEAAINGDPVQEWYLCLDGEKIIAGMGVIENDFHDRKDLTPNICAVYTEKQYRGKGISGKLLDFVVADNKTKGISPIYLLTNHTGFYERYGWKYLCMVQGDGEHDMSRMYIHGE